MEDKDLIRREAVARALLKMDDSWVALFADLGLRDLSYSDLLTQMWLHRDQTLHKTDLYKFMPCISRRTAVKYVQQLIDKELLQESESPQDKRVREVTLSDILIDRLERFFDASALHFSMEG